MKRINLVLISLLVVVSGFFASCSDDEDTLGANVTIKSAKDTTVAPSAVFVISWDARKGDDKMKFISISKNGVNISGWDKKEIPSASDASYIGSATITADPNAGVYEYVVSVLDGNYAELGKETVKVTVSASAAAGEINSYTTVLMGGQNNATTRSFWASTTNTVYKVADAKTNAAKVDILYFYGTTNAATLAAPDDADAATLSDLQLSSFTTKNKTRFGVSAVTSSEFSAIANDAKIATISGLTATKAAQLKVNDVIAFQTEAGKKGLILVKAIGGTQGSDRTITIDVKVQK